MKTVWCHGTIGGSPIVEVCSVSLLRNRSLMKTQNVNDMIAYNNDDDDDNDVWYMKML